MTQPPFSAYSRALSFVLAVVALGCSLAQVVGATTPSPPAKDQPAGNSTKALPFDAETQAYIDKLPTQIQENFRFQLDGMAQRRRQLWGQEVQREIRAVNKEMGLEDKTATAVEAAARPAIEESLLTWTAKMARTMRDDHYLDPTHPQTMMDQRRFMIWHGGFLLGKDEAPQPLQSSSWQKGLREILTPGQAQVWASLYQRRLDEQEKQLTEGFKRLDEAERPRQTQRLEAVIGTMEKALQLSPEETAKVREVGAAAITAYLQKARAEAEPIARQLDVSMRSDFFSSAYYSKMGLKGDLPENQRAWKEGLAGVLSSQELQQLEQGIQRRKERRTQALLGVFMVQVDSMVALTPSQRERLKPLAEKALKAAAKPPGEEEDASENFENSYQQVWQACSQLKDEELAGLLESSQIKSLRQALSAGANNWMNADQPIAKGDAADAEVDMEAVEHLLSDLLYQRVERQRQQLLLPALVEAEDARRICQLGPESAQRLLTAARGAAEAVLNTLRTQQEDYLRGQMTGASPREMKQRLLAIPGHYSPWNREGGALKEGRWLSTVKKELTPEQAKIWESEKGTRRAHRQQAITTLLQSALEERLLLSEQQVDQLREPLSKNIAEIETALPKSGFSSGQPWYFAGYMLYMPIAGIAEADLEKTLTKEQIDTLKKSDEYSNAINYWKNVVESREQKRGQR